MNIIEDLDKVSLSDTAVCLGNFDGFHLGHRFVVSLLKTYAKEKRYKTVIFTFHPHPMEFFGKEIPLIFTSPQRIEIFKEQGTDYLINACFDDTIATCSPEYFFKEILVKTLGAKILVVGKDYRFGAGRKGNIELLEELGNKYGVGCFFAEKVKDSSGIDISSSRIRQLILEGEMGKAAECLGRNYYIDGKIIYGGGRGKGFGFPTANIETENRLIPPVGVYATDVIVNGSIYRAMTYIGTCPSVAEDIKLCIETNIFNFSEDIYGGSLRIFFKERIRDEIKFSSIEELKIQMTKDKTKAECCE